MTRPETEAIGREFKTIDSKINQSVSKGHKFVKKVRRKSMDTTANTKISQMAPGLGQNADELKRLKMLLNRQKKNYSQMRNHPDTQGTVRYTAPDSQLIGSIQNEMHVRNISTALDQTLQP